MYRNRTLVLADFSPFQYMTTSVQTIPVHMISVHDQFGSLGIAIKPTISEFLPFLTDDYAFPWHITVEIRNKLQIAHTTCSLGSDCMHQ